MLPHPHQSLSAHQQDRSTTDMGKGPELLMEKVEIRAQPFPGLLQTVLW